MKVWQGRRPSPSLNPAELTSWYAAKQLGLAPPRSPVPVSESEDAIGPGLRGTILKRLSAGPRSIKELARSTGMNTVRVGYYLKTLIERGCVAQEPRHGRELRFSKRQFGSHHAVPTEPVVHMPNDNSDWRTWAFKLLCINFGMRLELPTIDATATATATATAKAARRILIIGSMQPWRDRLLTEFPNLQLLFFDNPKTTSTGYVALGRLLATSESVLICIKRCRHMTYNFVKPRARALTIVRGSLTALINDLKLEQQTNGHS